MTTLVTVVARNGDPGDRSRSKWRPWWP